MASNPVRVFKDHKSWVHSVAISPDGSRVLTGSADGTIRLWDFQTGKELNRYVSRGRARAPVSSVRFSPDGQRALIGSWGETWRRVSHAAWFIDLQTGDEMQRFSADMPVLSLDLSSDSRHVLTAHGSIVILWDALTEARVWEYPGLNASVVFSADSDHLYVADKNITEVSRETGLALRQFPMEPSPLFINNLSISQDGQYLLASIGYQAYLYDALRGIVLGSFKHEGVRSIQRASAISPQNKYFATAGEHTPVCLWDMQTRQQLARFEADSDLVLSVAFSPDNRYLLTGGGDHFVKIWTLEPQQADRLP